MGKFVKVKFCGLKKQEEIDFCRHNNVDFIGFVFCNNSIRNLDVKAFATLRLKQIPNVVAVFKNPSIKDIELVLQTNKVDFIQIHGNETDDILEYFHNKVGIIKAFSGEVFIRQQFEKYNFCDYFLFDGKQEGSGFKRDFSFAKNIPLLTQKPFFLAGGINASNVLEALKYTNYIDLSSGIEEERGVKSLKLMEGFLERVKSK